MRNVKFLLPALAALGLIVAGCNREITGNVKLADNNASANCFTCHSDQDWAFLHAETEYAVSVHATGSTVERNRLHGASYEECEGCHTHEGFVARINGTTATGDEFMHIQCFTCHAPHTNGNLNLRVDWPDTLGNGAIFALGKGELCVACHHARVNVNTFISGQVSITSSHWGPHHGVQGDMLIGTNGYEYAGYTYSRSWHGQNIEEGCPKCHMAPKSVWANVGGHTWMMADAVTDDENIGACNQCHQTFTSFNPDFPPNSDYDWNGTAEGVQDEVDGLIDSLGADLLAAGMVDSSSLGPISGTSFPADSAGALYNYVFCQEDRSEGIHNTKYTVGLLQSSINYLEHGNPNGAPAATKPRPYAAH